MKLRGWYTGLTISVCLSVHPYVRMSIDQIVFALYLPQYFSFQIHTSYQLSSGDVPCIEFLKKLEKFNFLAKCFTSWLGPSCSGLLWVSRSVRITINAQVFFHFWYGNSPYGENVLCLTLVTVPNWICVLWPNHGFGLFCIPEANFYARTFRFDTNVAVWYKTKFSSQNLATKFGNHLCMATKIGSQC